MKKIFLYANTPNIHSVYKEMLASKFEGYEFILPKKSISGLISSKIQKSNFLKKIYRATLRTYLYRKNSYFSFSKPSIPKNIDAIFSLGTMVDSDKPYVLDIIDNPYSLTGYNYQLFTENLTLINKNLSSENCRAVLVPFEDCKNLCESYFNQKIKDKLFLVNFGLNPKKFKPKNLSQAVVFLFVGSISNPDDFEIKGGVEVLEAFSNLSKKYPDKVKLYIRSKVPSQILKRYSLENIHIITEYLNEENLDKLYRDSHVFLTPAHTFVAMAPLEAMNNGLALIGRDTYGTREYVFHGKNGFLINPGKKFNYRDPKYMTTFKNKKVQRNMSFPDLNFSRDLAKNMEKFVLSPDLVNKLGFESSKIIHSKFSLRNRNQKIKEILDKVLSRD